MRDMGRIPVWTNCVAYAGPETIEPLIVTGPCGKRMVTG